MYLALHIFPLLFYSSFALYLSTIPDKEDAMYVSHPGFSSKDFVYIYNSILLFEKDYIYIHVQNL